MYYQANDEQEKQIFIKAINKQFWYKHVYTILKTRKNITNKNPDSTMIKD